jgi:hypothetical protein
MSSRRESTPPPSTPAGWDESAAFRETTLQHFTEPGHADLIRRFGAMLHDMALECATTWPVLPGYGTALQLRAAAADLRHLQAYLAQAGSDRHMSSLTPAEEVLAQLAERLAGDVARIAETIEQAIG